MKHWFLFLAITMPLNACISANKSDSKSQPALAELADRSYYRVDDGYTCRVPAPKGSSVESWRGKIIFKPEASKYYYWNNRCNDAPLVYDFDPSKFTFKESLDEFQYDGGTYRPYVKEPTQ